MPRAIDRMEDAVVQMLKATPPFEEDARFASQLGSKMAYLRDAAREVCRQTGVRWTSERDKERLIRFFFGSQTSKFGKMPPP